MPPRICHPAQPTLLRSFGLASLPPLLREGFGLRLPAPASLRRGEPLTQDLRPWQRAEGASMNLRPPRAQQRLPPRGEPCDRRPATSEASVSHGKPYAAADMLRRPARPPPPSASHASLRRSRPTAPPTPQTDAPSSCPSNKFVSPLFAHDFSFNYYKTIIK